MLETAMESGPGGKRVRVARIGSGPPLILLHGYPDNLQIWCALAPILARDFEVIAFDWPGMGYSEAVPGGTTPGHQADRLRDLLDCWHIEKAHVAGMDMGGQPALVFAARYPERVGRLVVMNSLLYGDLETSWEIGLLRRFGWNRVLLRRFPRLVFLRAERTFLPRGIRLPAALRADLWNSFRREEVRRFVVRLCAGYQGTLPRLPEIYRRIACPTFALWAGQDRHFPCVHAERLCAEVPGAQQAILPGAEHWMVWYQAGETAERMQEFLTGA